MKIKTTTQIILLFFVIMVGYSQPTILYTGLTSTTPSPVNNRFVINDLGFFRQVRFQSNQTAAASSLGWAYHIGSTATPDYSSCWRPYTGGNTISIDTYIPTTFANGARFNAAGGGADGLLPAITSGNYYTFNVLEAAGDNASQILETTYQPVSLVSQTIVAPTTSNNGAFLTVTASANPNVSEYVFVRYSTDGFATSSIVPVSFVGTTGTTSLPCYVGGTNVRYYYFSSNKTAAQLATDVASYGQATAYDLATLSILNNSGANYTYTQGALTTFEGVYYIPSPCYNGLNTFVTALNAGTISGPVTVNIDSSLLEVTPLGGIRITATGTAANPIVFQKNGAGNPTFTAATHTASNLNDGVFKIIGGDYITIDGFKILENPSSSITAAATNNMTEFGIGLFYASATDGCQNITLKNNTIDLNRNYQNSIGIYANSTHTEGAISINATAAGALGANNNLTIFSNTITDVNLGIIVIGPTNATDFGTGLTIGGTTAAAGNVIFNYGTTGAFSSFANVSGTVNGILVRNIKGFTIQNNTVSTSNGGVTVTGTIRGIYIPSFSNTPTGTFTNTISSNGISVVGGNNGNSLFGIQVEVTTGTATSTLEINDNSFTNIGHSVAGATGISTLISNAAVNFLTNINNNLFSDITANSSGSFTFINNSWSLVSGATKNVNNNRIVTAFNKTIAGGTVTFYQDTGSSVTGSFVNNLNNTFSNVTVTGATLIAGWNNQDGGLSSNPTKIITGNAFSSISSGTGTINILDVNGFGGNTSVVNNNSISTITTSGAGSLTGLRLGVNSTANLLEVKNNTVFTLNSGTSPIIGIQCNSPTTNMTVDANQVKDVLGGGAISGIQSINAAATISIVNSIIDNLKSSGITSPVYGISNTVTATINIQTNTIKNLELTNAASTATLRGINCSSASTAVVPTITGNTIELLTSASTTNSSTVAGINVSGSANYNISNNIVRNINANSTNAGSGGSTSLIGIVTGSSGASQKINNNTIHTISSNNTGAFDVKVAAIVNSSSLAGSEMFKNKIYNINNLATGTTSPIIAGFYNSGGGTWTVGNNMISLSNGANTNGLQCLGIFDSGNTGARSYYYNSIHIAGSSASALNSIAFQYNKGTGTVNIKNNICQNIRTGGGKNYAIANTGSGFSGLTFSNNILYAVNPNTIGLISGPVDNSFTAWTTSSSGPNSLSSLTTFINPTVGDLHIDVSTCSDADGTATPLAAVLDDYDNTTRDVTIPDIGADEHIKGSTIWNGTTWTPTSPSSGILAIIEGDYDMTLGASRPSFDACSLIVRNAAKLTISNGKYVNLENHLTVANNALLEVQNGGSLVQINNNGQNTTGTTAGVSNFSLKRNTDIRELDYVYWSAPVAAFPVVNVSSVTPTNKIWNWNTIVANPNGGQGNWENISEDMIAGKGYIVRGPTGWNPTTPTTYSATFLGKPNNGVYNPSIQRGSITAPSTTGSNGIVYSNLEDNWNLIGNPYPSSIKVADFLNANTNIEGAVRIWTHGNLPVSPINPFYNSFIYNYVASDYIVYNGTATTNGPTGFNGYIAAGQGFFVVINDGAATSAPLPTVVFNNSMRSKTYDNSQFYKNINLEKTDKFDNIEKHRIWLDIVAQTGETARTVIGYVAGATQEKDRLYDAYSSYQPELNLYSLINDEIMTIQGRSLPFSNSDIVPMGIKVPSSGTYTIAIASVDGLFTNNGQIIYIEDKLTSTIHNLSIAPYQFTTNQGIINNRFILRYTNNALSNLDFDTLQNTVSVYTVDNLIKINSSQENIKNYVIYDVLGRILIANNTNNSKQSEISSIIKNNQALIVKTTLENGQVITKKVVF